MTRIGSMNLRVPRPTIPIEVYGLLESHDAGPTGIRIPPSAFPSRTSWRSRSAREKMFLIRAADTGIEKTNHRRWTNWILEREIFVTRGEQTFLRSWHDQWVGKGEAATPPGRYL
ncbi:MAG: hypothetical protein ACLTLQ_03180 [[Clostridium] scindens]